jgi:alpha-methylacyl-CoA racemase
VTNTSPSKPLAGVTVVELAGIGPAPLACTILADMGCNVIRVERVFQSRNSLDAQLSRIGVRPRTTIAVDLKTDEGREVVTALVNSADVLIEAFRPGTVERLDLGPEKFASSNPGLVYVRLTGWGQDGPYATMAGHDINYIGLTGALAAIGDESRPIPPLNLLGDYAGGSMFAIVGILAALVERSRTGDGTVVDTAMIDGVSSLLAPIKDLAELGAWTENRSANMLDGGAPFYRTYETSDGGFMAVGALEPAFYSAFVTGLGLEESDLVNRFDPSNWIELAKVFGVVFLSATRDHWQVVFDDTDACVTPVLTMSEAGSHPQNQARPCILDSADVATEAARTALIGVGLSAERIDELISANVVAIP